MPRVTDMFLSDNICTFIRLFNVSSGLLNTFLLRYALTFPEANLHLETLEVKLISSGHCLEKIAALDRKGFYDLIGPYAVLDLEEKVAAAGKKG